MDLNKENNIIAHIYDAALDPQLWNQVMHELVEYTQSKTAIFTAMDQLNPAYNFVHTYNIPYEGLAAYRDERIQVIDMKLHLPLWNEIAVGEALQINCQHYPSMKGSEEHIFYEKCLKPTGILHLAGVLLDRGDFSWAVLGIHRAPEAIPYGKEQLDFLERISIHLRRALQIYRQFSLVIQDKYNAYQAMNALKVGIVLLLENFEIQFANIEAKKMLRQNQEIEIDQYNYLKLNRAYHLQLEQLIRGSLQQGSGGISKIGGVMTVEDATGHCIMLTIVPWSKQSMTPIEESRRYQVAIFLTDRNQYHILSQSYLRQHYQLTCREIALCEYLINGYKPEEIAEQMQLSIQTIRTYMKKIYEKLEVNSQIELIHKLMNCTLQFQHIA